MSVLLLNASYEPLVVLSRRRAVCLVLAGKAELVEVDETGVVRSAGGDEFPVPLVVRLKYMVRVPFQTTIPLTRRALVARDGGRCQVAGCNRPGNTVDHIVPRSKGGLTVWTNVVLMCGGPKGHNTIKGDRSLDELGWRLVTAPVAPKGTVARLRGHSGPVRPGWEPYLTWGPRTAALVV